MLFSRSPDLKRVLNCSETRWNTPGRPHKPSEPISRISIFRPKSCGLHFWCYWLNHFPAGPRSRPALKVTSIRCAQNPRTILPNSSSVSRYSSSNSPAKSRESRFEISDQVLWSKDGMTLTFGRKAPSARKVISNRSKFFVFSEK